MRDYDKLDERQQEILATIIRQYVSTGVPVGSKAVSVHFSEPLSSATIRNIMAELEAAGYLTQPHTSAGRIPADKAYRFTLTGWQNLPIWLLRLKDISRRAWGLRRSRPAN